MPFFPLILSTDKKNADSVALKKRQKTEVLFSLFYAEVKMQ